MTGVERGPRSALVTADWLEPRLAVPGIVVLDATVWLMPPRHDGDFYAISGRQTWLEGRIPTSRHADLIEDFADAGAPTHFALPAPSALAERVADIGINATDTVVVYDRDGGIWAARLWWMLRAIGVDARVLDGGWRTWVTERRRVAGGPPRQELTTARGDFQPGRIDRRAWVSLEDIEAVVAGQAEAVLVCALGAQAFTGAVPTRYARRGHIPGSTNTPSRDLVDDLQRLLPVPALLRNLEPILREPAPIFAYCGGGISACLLALALTELGRDDVRVYDGSLDEWTADQRRPVRTMGSDRSEGTT